MEHEDATMTASEHRASDDETALPTLHDERETRDAEPGLRRRLLRDAGADAARLARDPRFQHRPVMAQNGATTEQQVWGIVVQTREDLPNADQQRLRQVIQERLLQAGIDLAADDIARLLRRRPAARHE